MNTTHSENIDTKVQGMIQRIVYVHIAKHAFIYRNIPSLFLRRMYFALIIYC